MAQTATNQAIPDALKTRRYGSLLIGYVASHSESTFYRVTVDLHDHSSSCNCKWGMSVKDELGNFPAGKECKHVREFLIRENEKLSRPRKQKRAEPRPVVEDFDFFAGLGEFASLNFPKEKCSHL